MAKPNPPAGPRTDYQSGVAALQTRRQELASRPRWTKAYYGEDGIVVTDGLTVHKFALTLKGVWLYAKWEINGSRIFHTSDVSERKLHDMGAFDED